MDRMQDVGYVEAMLEQNYPSPTRIVITDWPVEESLLENDDAQILASNPETWSPKYAAARYHVHAIDYAWLSTEYPDPGPAVAMTFRWKRT